MKRNLCVLGVVLAAWIVIFTGCLHEDDSGLTNRLAVTEAELSTVRGELSTVRDELSIAERRIADTQEALEECQDSGLGILKVENNYPSGSIVRLYISPDYNEEWGIQWLGAPIPSHTWRHFGLDPGDYDIRAIFSTGDEVVSEKTIFPGEFTIQGYE